MVLINELTVEQINAALLHLQRSKDEVVGGNKGTTIQNITISNSGSGGNNVDYSGTIKNLATNIEKNKTAIEKNASDIAKLKSDFSNIEKSVEDTLQGLVDNGISDLSFDPLTKQLTITTNDGDTYQTVIEQDIGYLSYDSATNKLILTTGNQSQEITLPYILSSEKGSANGVATLDENGRVPYSQLPESAMEFLGQWDASTNTPHLADGTGTNGDFYIVSVGGTVDFGTVQDPHVVTFTVNDRVVYEGDIAQWVRLPAGQVSSVNGQSGAVTLTANDIEYSTGVSIKAKIDANAVQADWNVSDTTSLAYIKNKPTIPASPVQADWNVTDTTSLAYIKNKPATNLVCTCKYTSAYNFDVVLTDTCASQTQYTWVSANCRLRFCSSTGVLTAACFCGDLDGIVSRCGSVNGGYYVTVPSPANTIHYVLVNVGSVYGGNIVAQIYTSKYHISKSDSSSRVVTDGSNYGSFAYSHLGTEASPSSCIWLRFTGWRPMMLCGEFPITIVCNTTTAPSGVTFNSPVYNYTNRLLLASGVSCTGTATDDVGLLYASYNNSNMPGTYGNVIQMQTGTGATSRWGYQVAFPTSGCLQYRRWTNTTSIGGWNSFITSENISTQHVACADHATSADSAGATTCACCVWGCEYSSTCDKDYSIAAFDYGGVGSTYSYLMKRHGVLTYNPYYNAIKLYKAYGCSCNLAFAYGSCHPLITSSSGRISFDVPIVADLDGKIYTSQICAKWCVVCNPGGNIRYLRMAYCSNFVGTHIVFPGSAFWVCDAKCGIFPSPEVVTLSSNTWTLVGCCYVTGNNSYYSSCKAICGIRLI